MIDVLENQSTQEQVLKMTEEDAFSVLIIAALGALRKDKLNDIITARVLFDGTNGIMVNKRTRMSR